MRTDLDPNDGAGEYSRALIHFERGGGETLVENLRRVVELAPRVASGVASTRRGRVQSTTVRRGAGGMAARV